jgi:hypothetical protein
MKKVNIHIASPTKNISYKGLIALYMEYASHVHNYPFPALPATGDIIPMIHYLKRKDCNHSNRIGPYENITPFEAANRIATDLVLLKGLIQLCAGNALYLKSSFNARLGAESEKNKGDFSIDKEEGEAFNVAPTFYKAKLYQTLKKWDKIKESEDGILKFILINSDVVMDGDIETYHGKGILLFPVVGWDDISLSDHNRKSIVFTKTLL